MEWKRDKPSKGNGSRRSSGRYGRDDEESRDSRGTGRPWDIRYPPSQEEVNPPSRRRGGRPWEFEEEKERSPPRPSGSRRRGGRPWEFEEEQSPPRASGGRRRGGRPWEFEADENSPHRPSSGRRRRSSHYADEEPGSRTRSRGRRGSRYAEEEPDSPPPMRRRREPRYVEEGPDPTPMSRRALSTSRRIQSRYPAEEPDSPPRSYGDSGRRRRLSRYAEEEEDDYPYHRKRGRTDYPSRSEAAERAVTRDMADFSLTSTVTRAMADFNIAPTSGSSFQTRRDFHPLQNADIASRRLPGLSFDQSEGTGSFGPSASRSITGSYTCTYGACRDVFSTTDLLDQHMARHGSANKHLYCHMCPQTFTDETTRKRHRLQAHTDEERRAFDKKTKDRHTGVIIQHIIAGLAGRNVQIRDDATGEVYTSSRMTQYKLKMLSVGQRVSFKINFSGTAGGWVASDIRPI